MLTRVDRVQVVLPDRAAAVAAYSRLLDAEVVREDCVAALAARRSVLRLGASEVELLEPDGAGDVAGFLSTTGGGLFAAGLATPDVHRLRAHLEAHGVATAAEAGQLFVAADALGVPGLRVVISPAEERPRGGLVRHLYEVTLLVPTFAPIVERLAVVFGLDAMHFVPIASPQYGYDGVLTLFDPERLDRLEVITPTVPAKTMGRFFTKRGPSLYMCYCEADELHAIRARLLAHAPHDWTGPRDGAPDNLFIHPKALGGMMLGVSRTTQAWTWSGHPERVRSPGTQA